MRAIRSRNILALCLAAGLLLAGLWAPAAHARAIVGVGDNKPETFSNPLFRDLGVGGVKRTRLFTPYDSIFTEPDRLDQWIRAARGAGAEPLIAFEKPRNMTCPGSGCRAPSPASFTRAFRAFRAKYPTLRLISPWNEANSGTQPTGRNPRAAANYYRVVRRYCRGCRIVAADVLDITNQGRWLRSFLRFGGRTGTIWGLHNYGDTNRFRTTGIRTMLRTLPRGEIWLTETGGIVQFRTAAGRVALPASEERAGRAMRFLLERLINVSPRIRRVYIYNWRPDPFTDDRFDAGLLRRDGSTRQTFGVLKDNDHLIR